MQFRWQIAQFFELRWWQLYLSKKQKSDYLTWKKGYWNSLLENTNLSVPNGSMVLDAGCGPAGIFTILDHCQVDAIDPLLSAYSRKLPHFNPLDYPDVKFHEQTLESFKPNKQYDFVFCLNAINHVADLDICLDQLLALTSPQGKLIVSIDAHNYSFLKRIFRLFPGDILHPHQYSLAEYQAMLDKRLDVPIQTFLIQRQQIFSYYLLVANRYLGVLE